MQAQLEQRLHELKAEFAMGEEKLKELESQTNILRSTLLRISGAIQVLEEELDKVRSGNGAPAESGVEQWNVER